MSEELHSFIRGQLWLKLSTDIQRLFVTNPQELVSAAYFHIRRLLLAQPDWRCRICSDSDKPDILLYRSTEFRAAIDCEFVVSEDATDFPAELFNHRLDVLLKSTEQPGKPSSGRGYLIGVFDSPEPALYPEDEEASQLCYWLPVNCHQFPNYSEWRSSWRKIISETCR